jgi:drug/metabolite transporter (DMT)-like permease
MKLERYRGAITAIAAALLFGAGTPLAKILLLQGDPWLLAAMLYLGSGVGLWLVRRVRSAASVRLPRGEWRWLAGAIVFGGVIAPVLLMTGLRATPASNAALLLNAEGVFTALLAWFVFRENFDRRIALGMLAIVIGTVVLSWPADGPKDFAGLWPALAVLLACLAWAVDNNFTRKVALADASWIAMIKGLMAGSTNLVLAMSIGAAWPGMISVAGAALVGFLSYGASLVLFVMALRSLGAARTGAYFSVAPFFGALLAVALLHEPLTWQLLTAASLMMFGVWLHLTERHEHAHTHTAMEHDHEHVHGADQGHHEHAHDELVPPGTRHRHRHAHAVITHIHPHFPDAHHQHKH